MPELVELAGGVPLVTAPATTRRRCRGAIWAPWPPTSCCQAVRLLAGAHSRRGFAPALRAARESWPAVRAGRVYVADGNAYFNRPGPRIVDSLEILGACLHPEAFHDLRHKHQESAIRLDADLKQHAF